MDLTLYIIIDIITILLELEIVMSHREHVSYFLNATSKSSSSVDLANNEMENCQVALAKDQTIYVYGELTDKNINVILTYFDVYDDIKNPEVLEFLEE